MPTKPVASLSTRTRWLRRFAEATATELHADLSATEGRFRVKIEPAHFDGLYTALPRLQASGLRPYVFVDYSLDLAYPTLWYGVATTSEATHRRLVERAKSEWGVIRDGEKDEQATRARIAQPYSEHHFRDYYFGKYEWVAPNFAGSPPRAWIERATDFLLKVAAISWKESTKGTRVKRVPARASVEQRRGQPQFRLRLLNGYSRRCCVSGSRLVPLLEAAHIRTAKGEDDHSLSNGLLLRADLHTLFDLSLLAVDPKTLSVALHPSVQDREYGRFVNRVITIPSGVDQTALRRALSIRWRDFLAHRELGSGT